MTTKLPKVKIAGPELAHDETRSWTADVHVTDKKDDKLPLVDSTSSVRVLLQSPDATKIKISDTWRMFFAPELLVANVRPQMADSSHPQLEFPFGKSSYDLRAAVPKDNIDAGPTTLGYSTLVLAPTDSWPEQGIDKNISVPAFAIAEGRVRVLVRVDTDKADPGGPLRLFTTSDTTVVAAFVASKLDDIDHRKFPRVELATVKVQNNDHVFVAFDLTPDGIEFRGTIPNPLRALANPRGPDRISVLLRLVNIIDPRSPDKDVWTLELVREEGSNHVREFLSIVRNAFVPAKGRTLFLDIDSTAETPAVRWPLELDKKSLGLPAGSQDAWQMWIDSSAVRARLLGAPVRDGELPTEVSFVADLLQLDGSAGVLKFAMRADRRSASGNPITGPSVKLVSNGATITPTIEANAAGGLVDWFLDQDALARGLVDRYRKAGVHPRDTEKTYAFLPVTGGWLQFPLALPAPPSDKAAASKTGADVDAVPFEGTIEFVLDAPDKDKQPRGRRLAVQGTDFIDAAANFSGGQLQDVTVHLLGASGTVDGIVWIAAGSPSPENILPNVDAGPAALMGPSLAFRRPTAATTGFLPLKITQFTPGTAFTIELKSKPAGSAYVWRGYDEMPLITAIGMTRTSESSGKPSAIRGLLCRELEFANYDVALLYGPDHGTPSLELKQGVQTLPLNRLPLADLPAKRPGAEKPQLQKHVPLVPVTLPDIELEPDAGEFPDLRTRLRFDLPVLDELFADTRLPEKSAIKSEGEAAQPPPPDMPTSLDFDRLLEAWQKAVDRLDLSRVQAASAFDWSKQSEDDAKIGSLFEGTTWATKFQLDTLAKLDGGKQCAFGTYRLDGKDFSGRAALEGLRKTFEVDGKALKGANAGHKNPLRVLGFAAALWKEARDQRETWRDTRAALTASLPGTLPFDQDQHGLVYRDAAIIDIEKNHATWLVRATIAKPLPVEPPAGSEDRKLGLWFRDLPLVPRDANTFIFDENLGGPERTIGPRQSAFDREHLARSIYEWRFCNDANAKASHKASAYDFLIGPFRFRPLRLANLALHKPGASLAIKDAEVIGTVSLGEKEDQRDAGPFGPELAYATGNLVAISLKPVGNGGLTFKSATWSAVKINVEKGKRAITIDGLARLSFRIKDVPVTLGDENDEAKDDSARDKTTLLLTLNVSKTADGDGLPQLSSATLDTVLFGRHVRFTDGTASIQNKDAISATFKKPDGADLGNSSGVLLDLIKVEINPRGKSKIILNGRLRILASDPPEKITAGAETAPEPVEVVAYAFGTSLSWLNQTFNAAKDGKFRTGIDHQRGVIDIAVDSANQEVAAPIAGLVASTASIRASLLVATEALPSKAAPKPPAASDDFVFASVSGFGEFRLTSDAGPLTRFHHVVAGRKERVEGVKEKTPPAWTSRIEADLALTERESRIRWPIRSLPPSTKFEHLPARVKGDALTELIGVFDGNTALRHIVRTIITAQPVPTHALQVDEKPRRVSFRIPWTFHALVEHKVTTIKEDDKLALTWGTIDHVTAIDAKALVFAARDAIDQTDQRLAFAPTRKLTPPNSKIVAPGFGLRAFAQAGFPVEALARDLKKIWDDNLTVADGIVVIGAGPAMIATDKVAEGPFWPDSSGGKFITSDRQGVVLALPWLTAIASQYDLPGDRLKEFFQAPKDSDLEWKAPDIDWAAGTPMPVARKPTPKHTIILGSASEIAGLLARLMQSGPGPDEPSIKALTTVEQVFLDSKTANIETNRRPMWLRSLLALRTVWDECTKQGAAAIDDCTTLVVPSGQHDGRVARFKLAPRVAPKKKNLPPDFFPQDSLIAIDRSMTRSEFIPVIEETGAADPGISALQRARNVARADRLVGEPVALLVSARRGVGKSTTIWTRVSIPFDLDEAANDIPNEIESADRLYASPALGWPTEKGAALAASGALGMGEDRPFQDISPKQDPKTDDVKDYGSGLSGRAASLSLPARAKGDRRSPIFYALGRKTIFDRPDPDNVPVVAPPARHLSPTEARLVVPTARDIDAALCRAVKGEAAPIVPPHLERIGLGLRPGAMQAEFDMLVFTEMPDTAKDKTPVAICDDDPENRKDEADENLNGQVARFGRPGHAGPRLVRQLRPPRGPSLPRVPIGFVTSHGRRTFVELDDKEEDGRFTVPFRLFEGPATVLRRGQESYRIRVVGMPLVPEWTGTLTLRLSSPSYPSGHLDDLRDALARLGVLSAGGKNGERGMAASLSIDRLVVPFTRATWKQGGDEDGLTIVELTLVAAENNGARAMLDQVDGDSEVLLQIRCAKEDSSNAPAKEKDFELPKDGDEPKTNELEPETHREISLRLPVRPTARPSLPIETATLVFADPSYDRELSGAGPSDPQRDTEGALWKLALDRFEYGTDTPLYFAFGMIDTEKGTFDKTGQAAVLKLERQPATDGEPNPPAPQELIIVGLAKTAEPGPGYAIKANEAYGLTFDRLRNKQGEPVTFLDGDQIVVTVTFRPPNQAQRILSVRAMVVPRPIIAPPPAVYSLVAPFEEPGINPKRTARAILHATAPLPQGIEFPELLKDLALGHIRRRALFIWPTSSTSGGAPKEATLIKIDRAGGGQLPDQASDLQEILRVKAQ